LLFGDFCPKNVPKVKMGHLDDTRIKFVVNVRICCSGLSVKIVSGFVVKIIGFASTAL
jgi:hypothetical protein